MTRTAISPRLAMRTFLYRTDGKQSLPVLHRLPVHHEFAFHNAADLGFDLVHQLHALDDAQHLAGLDAFTGAHERGSVRSGGLVERADDGALHMHDVGIGRGLFGFGGFRRGRRNHSGNGMVSRGLRRLRRRGISGACYDDLLRRCDRGTPDADTRIPALHFQLRNARFCRQGDQFSYLIDGHQWISLTDVVGWTSWSALLLE